MALLLAGAAWGNTAFGVVRWPGGDLYTEPNFASAPLGKVPRGEKVEFLQRENIWWKVRWRDKEGWMNRIFIERPEAPASTGVAVAAPTAGATTPSPPQASNQPSDTSGAKNIGRAVIFGISQYQPGKGIPTLAGVVRDMDSAVAMAQLMGISSDRISIHRDGLLGKAAMTAILTQLATDVRTGEPLLVYFSGHGGRRPDTDSPGRCIEGLVAYDGELLSSAEMAKLLQPLAASTDRLFVFFDACHSGGMTATRTTGTASRLTAKFVARGDVSNCSEVVNMLQPSPGTRSTASRYVYTAAARSNEVSFDDQETGGVATSNFLRCMVQGEGRSVEAIRDCAQVGIGAQLAGFAGIKPHNLTITGDVKQKPVAAGLSRAAKDSLLARAGQGLLAPADANAARVGREVQARGWAPLANPGQAFASIVARSDGMAGLAVDAPATLKIDREPLRMNIQAPADGFVYVFQAAGDGSSAVMLFPNLLDSDNRIRKDQTLALPRPSWPLMAGGPPGENQLLVVFSSAERDLSRLLGQEVGPFLDLNISPLGLQALSLALARSAHADADDCKPGPSAPAHCNARYTARVTTVRELP